MNVCSLSHLHVRYVRLCVHIKGGRMGVLPEVWMNGESCNCLQDFKDVYIICEALMGSNAK